MYILLSYCQQFSAALYLYGKSKIMHIYCHQVCIFAIKNLLLFSLYLPKRTITRGLVFPLCTPACVLTEAVHIHPWGSSWVAAGRRHSDLLWGSAGCLQKSVRRDRRVHEHQQKSWTVPGDFVKSPWTHLWKINTEKLNFMFMLSLL